MKSLITFALAIMLTAASTFAVDGPIRHVVAFKFKADADPKAVKKVEVDFAALKTKIPLVQTLEWGTDVSPEKHDKGFTHCWIVSFKDAKDRDAYLVHPEHKAFAAELKDIVDDVFVLDFVPQG